MNTLTIILLSICAYLILQKFTRTFIFKNSFYHCVLVAEMKANPGWFIFGKVYPLRDAYLCMFNTPWLSASLKDMELPPMFSMLPSHDLYITDEMLEFSILSKIFWSLFFQDLNIKIKNSLNLSYRFLFELLQQTFTGMPISQRYLK